MQSRGLLEELVSLRNAVRNSIPKQSALQVALCMEQQAKGLLGQAKTKKLEQARKIREAQKETVKQSTETLLALSKNLKEKLNEACHPDIELLCDSEIDVQQEINAITRVFYVVEGVGDPAGNAQLLINTFNHPHYIIEHLRYYAKQNQECTQVMHDACLYALPQEKYSEDIWQKLAQKHFQDARFWLFIPHAAEIEQLICQSSGGLKINRESIKQLIVEYSDINKEWKALARNHGQLTYEEEQQYLVLTRQRLQKLIEIANAHKGTTFNDKIDMLVLESFYTLYRDSVDPAFSWFFEHGLSAHVYRKFQALNLQNGDTPNIPIDCSVLGHEGFYFIPIDVQEKWQAGRAATFGVETGCCQTLSHAGEDCVVHGLTDKHGGFYMLCAGDINKPKLEDELHAQCWLWRNGRILGIDSVECNRTSANEKMIVDAVNYLAFKAIMSGEIDEVVVGTSSGISYSFGSGNSLWGRTEYKIVNYDGYSDAKTQSRLISRQHGYFRFYQRGDRHFLHAVTRDLNQAIVNILQHEVTNEAGLSLIELIQTLLVNGLPLQCNFSQYQALSAVEQYLELMQKDDGAAFAKAVASKSTPFKVFNNGMTALMCAMHHGLTQEFELLLQQSTINARDFHGNAAIHYAAKKNNFSLMRALIANGADMNVENNDGKCPLYFLVEYISENQQDSDAFELLNKLLRGGLGVASAVLKLAIKQDCEFLVDRLVTFAEMPVVRAVIDSLVEHQFANATFYVLQKAVVYNLDRNRDSCYENLFLPKLDPFALSARGEQQRKNLDHLFCRLIHAKYATTEMARSTEAFECLVGYMVRYQSKSAIALLSAKLASRQLSDERLQNLKRYLALLTEFKPEDFVNFCLLPGNQELLGPDCASAILFAAKFGMPQAIIKLVEAGADVNLRDFYYRTVWDYLPLDDEMAVLGVVKTLFEIGAEFDADSNARKLLEQLLKVGNRSLFELCLRRVTEFKTMLTIGEDDLLISVIKKGWDRIAISMIEKGCTLDSTGEDSKIALHVAISQGLEDVAALMVQRGAKLNMTFHSTILCIAENEQKFKQPLKLAQLVLDYGEDIDRMGESGATQLVELIKRGATEYALLSIPYSNDLNSTSLGGQTPLMAAVESGDVKVVRLLMAKSVDTAYRSLSRRQNALDLLSIAYQTLNRPVDIEIAQVFVDASVPGANELLSVMQAAHSHGRLELVAPHCQTLCRLIENGQEAQLLEYLHSNALLVDTFVTNPQGVQCTLLMYACQKGQVAVAKGLVTSGADVYKADLEGKLVFTYAKQSETVGAQAALCEMLLEAGVVEEELAPAF